MKRVTALKVLTATLVVVLLASAYPLAHLVVSHLEGDAPGASSRSGGALGGGDYPLPFDSDAFDGSDGQASPSDGATSGGGSSSRPAVPGSSTTAPVTSSTATGSALLDQVLGSARLLGHDVQVPDLPLAKLSASNPLRHAVLSWIAATGASVPPAELTRELARADALPLDLQRDLAILVLSAAEATLLQREALASLPPEDLAWLQANPQVAQDLVAGVNSPDTLRMAGLASQVDITKSLQATLLMLEAVEVTRGRLAAYDAAAIDDAVDGLQLDPQTRALFEHLAAGAGPTDAEKVRFAADLVAASTGFPLERSPLPKISFEQGIEHFLAATGQPADAAALRTALRRADALPQDLNEALGTLLLAQASAISAANPAVATPELQAQALVDVLEAAAQALPTLEKYHYFWSGAPDALRVGQWAPEERLKWAANHAGLFVGAGVSPTTVARVAASQMSGGFPAIDLPARSFPDALDAYLRVGGESLSADERAQLADVTSWLEPVVLEASATLLSGAAEAARLDAEAWAGLSNDDRAFLIATTETVADLYLKPDVTADDVAVLARFAELSARVDAEKLAAAGAVGVLAAERAAALLEQSTTMSAQADDVTLRATGWQALLAKLMPIGTARAQTPASCVQLPETIRFGNVALVSNDCKNDVLLRVTNAGSRFFTQSYVNHDIFVLTGPKSSTLYPPTGTVFELYQGADAATRDGCVRSMSQTFCPEQVSQLGASVVHLDLGGNDKYNLPVATTTPTQYRQAMCRFGPVNCDAFFTAQDAILARPVSIHVDVGGSDAYYDPTAFYETNRRFESYYGALGDHPTQGSAYGGGVAVLYDVTGSEYYQSGDRSQGYGRWGFGALIDAAGSDIYVGERFVQGAASEMLNLGAGLLLDVAGRDTYEAQTGQGYGVGGVLLDLSGADSYTQLAEPLGIPAVRLEVIPGGNLTDVSQRGDGRIWLDGPDALNVGIGIDQEISADGTDDTDHDEFPDSLETMLGSDPKDRSDTPVEAAQNRTAAILDDSDKDGWSDALERAFSTDPKNGTEFPAHVPRDVGKNLPDESGDLAKPTGGKILDLRVPLQDAGRIEKACANRQLNGTAIYTPRNLVQNSEGNLLAALSFNESKPSSGSGFTSTCIALAYETDGQGSGNGTLSSAREFEYDLPMGILAIGDTDASTYDIDYFFVVDFGGADTFENAAGGSLPIVFREGSSAKNMASRGASAPSISISIDGSGGAAGRDDVYQEAKDAQRLEQAHGSLLGVLIDTSGDDYYRAGNASQGAKGGVLLDLAGADTYHARSLSQGTGYAQDPNRDDPLYHRGLDGDAGREAGDDEAIRRTSPGILADFGDGGDRYEALSHSQGAGRGYSASCAGACESTSFSGVSGEFAPYSTGILYDEDGADTYTAGLNSQGVGSARATGVLADAGGDDEYRAVGVVSHGATISRTYLQPQGSTNAHYPAVGALLDLGGGKDVYTWDDGEVRDRSAQRQNNITMSMGSASPDGTQPSGWAVYSDRGIHIDTTQETLAGTLAGTGTESPYMTEGRDLGDEDDYDADEDGDIDPRTDADVFLLNMPSARLAIGNHLRTHYTHEYAFVVDLGGDNAYNFTAAGFIGDLVARGPVDPNLATLSREHPVVTLFPVTFLLDAGTGASTYRTQRSLSQGAGFFGVGILIDSAGTDTFLAEPSRLESLGSGWMTVPAIPDGSMGEAEWANASVVNLSMVGQKDARFPKDATVRIGNDHENIYIAIEVPMVDAQGLRVDETLVVDLDTHHDRSAARDEAGRTGIDQVRIDPGCAAPRDRYAVGEAGGFANDPILNPDDVPDVKAGCSVADGRRVYEIIKPLRATFPADAQDLVLDYDRTLGLLETRLGLRIEYVESIEHSTPETFAWPAGSTNVDGALGYRADRNLHDEMRDWAALTLANLGKSANATNATRVSPMAQGAGVGGIGVLAHLASDNSSATFVASERSQGYGAYGGIGLLFDGGSGDTYVGDRLVQAAAEAFGLGILVDSEGNDNYRSGAQSGGYAEQAGATALLMDLSGTDEYTYTGLGRIRVAGQSIDGRDTDRIFDSDLTKRFPPGNQRIWFQGSGGVGIDQNSPDKQSEVVRDYVAKSLFGSTQVAFEIRAWEPENGCLDTRVPQNTAGATPRFVVRGMVCLFAQVDLPRNGHTLTTETVDFLIDDVRIDLPVERMSTIGSGIQFEMPFDASGLEDGIRRFGAIARMRAADSVPTLLYTVPARELSVQVSNAPIVQLDLQPAYTGATDAAFSPGAVTSASELSIRWNVSHDADEDRLELFQGWRTPAGGRNVPCSDAQDRPLCNIIPFYIVNNLGAVDTQPGQSLTPKRAAEPRGDSSLSGRTNNISTDLVLVKDDTFRLHIHDRQAFQKQNMTTVVTVSLVNAAGGKLAVLAQGEFTTSDPTRFNPATLYQLGSTSSTQSRSTTFDALCATLPACAAVAPALPAPPTPSTASTHAVTPDNWTDFVLDLNVSALEGLTWSDEGESVRIRPATHGMHLAVDWSLKGIEDDSPVVDEVIDTYPGNTPDALYLYGPGIESRVRNGYPSTFTYGTADAPTRFEIRVPTEPSTRTTVLLQRLDDPENHTYQLPAHTLVEGDSEGTPELCGGERCTQFVTRFDGTVDGEALADGAYRAHVLAMDAVDQTGAVNQTFLLDGTSPSSRVTTPSNVGRVLLVNGRIPVTWNVTETGENASGLKQVHLFARPVTAPESPWTLAGSFPESVTRALYSPAKDVSRTYEFLTIAEDRVGNLELLSAKSGQRLTIEDALEAKVLKGLTFSGYQRVTIDEGLPLVTNPRVEGGRALNYKGSDVVFTRAGEDIRFVVQATDDASGTGIGRVDIAFVYADPATGSITSHLRNLCEGACPSGTFTYSAWGDENGATDADGAPLFPDGIWGVIFDVYDSGSNRVRVNVGNVLLDSGLPTVNAEPAVYPPGKAAASLGDRVSLRVRASDAFGIDEGSLSADVSAISSEGVVTFRPLRVDGVIYQEANFVMDREDALSGIYDVVVSVRDNAGNAASAVLPVAVDVSTFEIVPESVRVIDTAHDSFTVTWNTTEPTNAYVKYGAGLLKSKTATTSEYTTTHTVVVTGLDSSTGYQFRVVSSTPGGFTTESDTLTVTTKRALYLEAISPEEGDALSGVVPVRFEGGVLGADGLVTYTLEARSGTGNYSFVTTASRRGDLHSLNFNSSRYLDGSDYMLRLRAEYGRETLSVEFGPFLSDNTPPEIDVIGPLQATNLTQPEIRAEVRDNLAGFATNAVSLLIDGESMLGVSTSPIQDEEHALSIRYAVKDELAAGPHAFELRVVDAAGNAWTERWNVTIDGDAPVLTPNLARYDPGLAAAKLGGTATLNVTVEDAGGIRSVVANTSLVSSQPATLLFRQIGTDHFIGTFPVIAGDAEATLVLPVLATDLAGNEASTTSTIVVDNAPPTANEFVTVTTGHTTATIRTTASEPVLLAGRASAPRSPDAVAQTTDLAQDARLTFTGLLPSRVYDVVLSVIDGAGNTVEITGTLQTSQDSMPPGEVDGLTVTDLLNGTLRLTWRPATDDVQVAKYRIYRSDDGVNYVPVGESTQTLFEDAGLPYERNYLYQVVAVDHGGNEGRPLDAVRASATALPRLEAGDVSPAVGSVSTTFKYTIRYVSPGGVPPAYVRILLDGVAQDMTLVGEPDYANGALYEYATRLSPHKMGQPHTYTFEASDGRYAVRFPADSEPVRGPLVSADANADQDGGGGLANFAQNVPLGGTVGALAGIALAALAVALLVRKKKEGSK